MRWPAASLAALALAGWAVAAQAADAAGYRLTVAGLVCRLCAYSLERRLKALPDVAQIETDIATGTVLFTMQSGATLERGALARIVKGAGFTLSGVEPLDPTSSVTPADTARKSAR
ncbi:MAG: heavy-metal-associated domain-containing protein [Alphaproteobacteria bacterium]